MSNPELTPDHLIAQQHEQIAREATARIMGYIALDLRHVAPGGMTGDDELPEGKNG